MIKPIKGNYENYIGCSVPLPNPGRDRLVLRINDIKH
jgi:hypothetical protein